MMNDEFSKEVFDLLLEGWGVEDISILTERPLPYVRLMVAGLRKSGKLQQVWPSRGMSA